MIYLFGGVLAAVVLALAALVVLPRRHGIRRSMPAAPRTLADIVSSVSTGLDGIRRKLSRQAVSGPRADSVRRGLQERRRLHMGTPPLRSRATTKLHDLVPRRGVPDREFHQQHRPESVPRQASTRSGAVGTRHFAGTGRPLRSLASGTAAVSRERSLRMAVAVETGPSAAGSQDAYVIQNGIIAVARGVSGTSIDHRAAALALSAVISARPQDTDDAAHALQDCVATANRTIRAISQRDPELSGMVTTLDVVCLAPGTKSSMLHFAHVGNSTIWLQRRGRTVVRLNGLALRNLEVFEAVELDPAGDAGHAGLVVAAPGEVAGFLRLAGAGPAGAVADCELRAQDLQQEDGQGQVQAVRGKRPP